jgi:tetratricopeptide (TPR) repeat protein
MKTRALPFSFVLAALAACSRTEPPRAGPTSAVPAATSAPAPTPASAASTPAPRLPAPEPRRDPGALKGADWFAEVQDRTEEARAALAQGKRAEALELLDTVLEILPGHVPAVLDKARILREDGRFAEAIATLDRALAQKPDHATLTQERALAQIGMGDAKGALQTLGPLLAGGDPLPFPRYVKAVAFANLGEKAQALGALEDAVNKGYSDVTTIEKEKAFSILAGDLRFETILTKLRNFQEHIRRDLITPTPPNLPPEEGTPPR